MKMFTDKRTLVSIVNVPFTAVAFDMLLKLSLVAPNLRLETVEVHGLKPRPVRLCMLDFDWQKTNAVNIPFT